MTYIHFYILVNVLTAIPIRCDENAEYSNENAADGMKLNDNIRENRNELKRVIDILNGHINERENGSGQKSNGLWNGLENHDADIDDGPVEGQVNRLRGLLRLLQRSYDDNLRMDHEPSESRIHVIANPEVLEDFKRSIRSEHQSTFDDTDMETSSSIEHSYFGRQTEDLTDNHDEENVDSNRALPPTVMVIKRKSRLGPPSGIGMGFRDDQTRSNEMYRETKLSWKEVDASHERFDTQKPERGGSYPETHRGAVKKSPKTYKASREVVKKLATHGKRDEERSRSVERWKKVDRGLGQPKRSRPQAYNEHKQSNRSGRTSIPFIGKQGIYEEEE